MAIIEYGGGFDGAKFKKYLEDAKKHGRELGGRTVMDERAVLFGNLDVFEKITSAMENEGELYLHVSASFTERDLPVEVLLAYSTDYITMLMAAFEQDEYYAYAEVHYARLKGYVDVKGKEHDRLDHIHFGIPNINLLTGDRLEPGGFIQHNFTYLDAIQETLNEKYGLVSPKDRSRDKIGDVEIIKRSRLENFKKGKISATRKSLLALIETGVVKSYAEFQIRLTEIGQVKIVNAGKQNEYLGVLPAGEKKFINLRDVEFRKAFFDLSAEERSARIEAPGEKRVGVGKRTSAETAEILADWRTRRSLEEKYLNSGSKLYKRYQTMSTEEKAAYLKQCVGKFYQRASHDNLDDRRAKRGRPTKTLDADDKISSQQDFEKNRGVATSRTIHSVQSMHASGLNSNSRNDKGLLQGPDAEGLDPRRASPSRTPRRDVGPRRGGNINPQTGRKVDSAIAQRLRDTLEGLQASAGNELVDIKEIKLQLPAERLLNNLSRSHAAKPKQYIISQAADGSARIRHVDSQHNFNVADFLTKHMHMPWIEAEAYLRASMNAEIHNSLSVGMPLPSPSLWRQFQIESEAGAPLEKARKTAALASRRTAHTQQKKLARTHYAAMRATIRADKLSSSSERKARLSIVAMRRVKDEDALRAQAKIDRDEARKNETYRQRYLSFLHARATAGDETALGELRSQRESPTPRRSAQHGFSSEDNGRAVLPKGMQHQVSKNGDVVYFSKDGEILRDYGQTVVVVDQTDDGLLLGLRLAQAKFGKKISSHGSDKFIDRSCYLAAKHGLVIQFKNPEHQARYEKYRDEIVRLTQAKNGWPRTKMPMEVAKPSQQFRAKLDALSNQIVGAKAGR